MRFKGLRSKLVLPALSFFVASNLLGNSIVNAQEAGKKQENIDLVEFLDEKIASESVEQQQTNQEIADENLENIKGRYSYPDSSTAKNAYLTLNLAIWKNDAKTLESLVVPETLGEQKIEGIMQGLREKMVEYATNYDFDGFMQQRIFPRFSNEAVSREAYKSLKNCMLGEGAGSFPEYLENNAEPSNLEEEAFTSNLSKVGGEIFVKIGDNWIMDEDARSHYTNIELANLYLDGISKTLKNFKKGFAYYPSNLKEINEITIPARKNPEKVKHLKDPFLLYSKNNDCFKYSRFNEGFIIYSVGPDLKDNTAELLPGLIASFEKGIISQEQFKQSLPHYNPDAGIDSSGDIIKTSFD